MSLLVAAALAAGSFVVGRWMMRTGDDRAERAKRLLGASDRGKPATDDAEVPRTPSLDRFAEFPCTLGDVILRTGGGEAWLAGGLVFSEEAPVAALFVAPDAGGDRAVYVCPGPNAAIGWLRPLAPDALGALSLGNEPPNALELDGVWFARRRRLPVRVERVGSGAPDVGENVILAEYGTTGADRVIVVAAPGVARVWRGAMLDEGLYDVLSAGSSTLDANR